jgi:hypothetical protein
MRSCRVAIGCFSGCLSRAAAAPIVCPDHGSLTADLHAAGGLIRECRVSAEILNISDYRMDDSADGEIDLVTAVDVAIRDLREILVSWGSEVARQRAQECESTLRRAFSRFVVAQSDYQ